MHHWSYLLSERLEFIIERMEIKKKKKGIPKTKEAKEIKLVGKKWKRSESASESVKEVVVKRWKESEDSEFQA